MYGDIIQFHNVFILRFQIFCDQLMVRVTYPLHIMCLAVMVELAHDSCPLHIIVQFLEHSNCVLEQFPMFESLQIIVSERLEVKRRVNKSKCERFKDIYSILK